MSNDKRSKILSFFKPFSRIAPSRQDQHDPTAPSLEPSAPIPLGPQDIPLPQITLGRGISAALTSYTGMSGVPSSTGHPGPITRYPSFQSNDHSSPQTPARLPSHLSLSTMGFGSSPFRVIASDTPEVPLIPGSIADCDGRDRHLYGAANVEQSIGPTHNVAEDRIPRQSGIPTLASAIQIRETMASSEQPARDETIQARSSTWRLPRSISRNSLFETWGHGKIRRGSVAGSDHYRQQEVMPTETHQARNRINRKMSIDNIVHSISRRSQIFRVKQEEEAAIGSGDSRRWTAVYSEASDDSLAAKARTSNDQSKTSRMALPPMRSIRNKFTLTKRASRRSSILDIGSGRNGSPIRLSAMFQRPSEPTPLHRGASGLDLSEVQDTVEINRSPDLTVPDTAHRQAPTIGPQPGLPGASTLTLPLSPARDDISILDPSRTPLPMKLSISTKSARHLTSAQIPEGGPRRLEPEEQETDLSTAMGAKPSESSQSFPSDHSSKEVHTRTDPLPASDSRNVLLSTMDSLRTMSELASTDSSESLAARMKHSLSELKSAFKRMRNMSDLDLSSIDGSRRTSGHNDEMILPAPEDTANDESKAKDHGGVIGGRCMSSTKMTAYMSPSESLAGTEGKMSCAPSGTSWHTAKEDLHISYGSLAGMIRTKT